MVTVLVLSLLLVDEASSVFPEGYCNLNPGYCKNGGKQSQLFRVSSLLLASGQRVCALFLIGQINTD